MTAVLKSVQLKDAADPVADHVRAIIEHLGEDVQVVLGSDRNIKITRPSDMALAHFFHEEQTSPSGDDADPTA